MSGPRRPSRVFLAHVALPAVVLALLALLFEATDLDLRAMDRRPASPGSRAWRSHRCFEHLTTR